MSDTKRVRMFPIGEHDQWPDVVKLVRDNPNDARTYLLRERSMASRIVRANGIGHDECGVCGQSIDMDDSFCRRCGTEVYR